MEERVKEYYEHAYSEILTRGLLGRIQKRIHKEIDQMWATDLSLDLGEVSLIEVGCGDLEHLRLFEYTIKDYLASDIRPLKHQLTRYLNEKSFARYVQLNAEDLSTKKQVDVLIATCLLIHLSNPEKALINWKNAVKKNGVLVIYVPTDPGMLIRLMRRIFVAPKHAKQGSLDYYGLIAKEHRTSLWVLHQLILEVFNQDDVIIRKWPFRAIPSWNFNLAYIYRIRIGSKRNSHTNS